MIKKNTIRPKLTLLITTLIMLLVASGCSQQRRAPVKSHHQAQQNASSQAQTQNRPTPRQSTSQRQVRQHSQTSTRAVQTQSHARNRIVGIAKSTLGTHYKYGGNNPRSGFDCSGLMSYVHRQGLGLNIPRTATKQRDNSRTINYAQLQPGDMLFFKTGKRTNHVGVYIGDRQFIHASTGRRQVMVAKMDSKYWHSRFVKFGTFF